MDRENNLNKSGNNIKKSKNIPDQEETFSLDKILQGLMETKKGLDEAIPSLVQFVGPDSIPVKSVKEADRQLTLAIPAFKSVIEKYDDLKTTIIRPVNEMIAKSSRVGLWLTIVGIILTVSGLFASIISLQSRNRANQAVEKLEIYGKSEPTLEDKISSLIGKSSKTYDVIADYKIKMINILENSKAEKLKQELDRMYNEVLGSLKGEEISEGDLTRLAIMRIYMTLAETIHFKSRNMIDILSSIDMLLNKNPVEEDRIDLLWLKSEAQVHIGSYKKSRDVLLKLNIEGFEDYKVIDIANKRLVSIKSGIEERSKVLETVLMKNEVEILLMNASLFKQKNLAGSLKDLLVRNGFSESKIFAKDHYAKVSKVYAYYRNDNDKPMLMEILKIMYPRMQDGFYEISRFDISINPWVFKEFEINQNLTFLVRLPGRN